MLVTNQRLQLQEVAWPGVPYQRQRVKPSFIAMKKVFGAIGAKVGSRPLGCAPLAGWLFANNPPYATPRLGKEIPLSVEP